MINCTRSVMQSSWSLELNNLLFHLSNMINRFFFSQNLLYRMLYSGLFVFLFVCLSVWVFFMFCGREMLFWELSLEGGVLLGYVLEYTLIIMELSLLINKDFEFWPLLGTFDFTIEHRGFFSLQHLLWNKTSFSNVISKDPFNGRIDITCFSD